MPQKKILVTLEEIATYYGRSKNTVRFLVKNDNFPAIKIEGRWESNTELIDKYQRHRVEKRCGVNAPVAV